MVDTKIDLCADCVHQIPECEGWDSQEIEFGDGFGNDNICVCPFHETGED